MSIQAKQIPAGWTTKTLSELCDILIGGTPSRDKKEYWDSNKEGNNVWISIRDLSNGHKYIAYSAEYISDIGVKKSNVKPIPKGTVLMSFKLTIGRTAITDREVYTNEAIAGFLVKNKEFLDPNFLYYALPTLHYDVDTAVKGATLNKEKLRTTNIILPSLPEQTKIAAILSKVDEEIENVEKIIERSEKLKKGLMQKLLTKGIGHTKFKQTELGEIPEEWAVIRLEEIIDKLQAGVSVNSENRLTRANEIGILKTSSVTYGKFNPTEHKTIIEKDLDRVSTKVEGETIIISRMNTPLLVGANCYVDRDYNHLFLPDRLWKIILKDKNQISVLWLSYLLGHEEMREKIRQIATGTSASMKNISKEKLLNLSIVLPSLKEQKQIVAILLGTDRHISINQRIKFKLFKLKKGLMNDLLSGKVRVNH